MFTSIDSIALSNVTGGTASPKYLASPDELARRSHMTPAQRTATDDAWRKTFASLSPERQAQIREKASGFAARAKAPEVKAPEIIAI